MKGILKKKQTFIPWKGTECESFGFNTGHLDMVRFLLEAGADQEHKTDEMHTALMEACMVRTLHSTHSPINTHLFSFRLFYFPLVCEYCIH